jgi:hypothetical protein
MPDIVERADVRMSQAGNGSSFTLEPFALFQLIGKMGRKNFYCDDAIESRVSGAVHLAHSPRTYGGQDFVGAQTFTRDYRQDQQGIRLKAAKALFLRGMRSFLTSQFGSIFGWSKRALPPPFPEFLTAGI